MGKCVRNDKEEIWQKGKDYKERREEKEGGNTRKIYKGGK